MRLASPCGETQPVANIKPTAAVNNEDKRDAEDWFIFIFLIIKLYSCSSRIQIQECSNQQQFLFRRLIGQIFPRTQDGHSHHRRIRLIRFHARRGKSALAAIVIQSYHLLMLDWSKCAAVERIAGKVSGAW